MADADFEDFFTIGSGTSDGFPPNPQGSSLESTGHSRFYPIDGTVDSIRLPQEPQLTVTTLGYRREDATGSGGASEWLIDWNAIATFLSVNATTLSGGGSFHTSVIKNSKFYLGFQDLNNAIDPETRSYIVRANLITGAIEDVLRINPANVTVIGGASGINDSMEGFTAVATQGTPVYWDIGPTGNLRMAFGKSTDADTKKGISFVELSELSGEYITLVSESIFFNYDSTFGMTFGTPVTYFTEDLSIFVTGDPDDIRLVIPGHGVISIPSGNNESFVMQTHSILAALVSIEISTTVNQFNHTADNSVQIMRRMSSVTTSTNADRGVSRMQVNRSVLDRNLVAFVRAYSGIIL